MRDSKMTVGFAVLLLIFMAATVFPVPSKSTAYQILQAGGSGNGPGRGWRGQISLSTFRRVYIIIFAAGEYSSQDHTLYNTVY
ncbi:MAG: hypothetical protein LBO65_10185 [Spirochaetaceae bacterium]|nr:hypothetical protein [Spirochaetaceae bacterium]